MYKRQLNIAALLSSKKDEKHKDAVEFATVQVPGVLPRLVPIPADTSENSGEVEGRTFILLEQIIEKNIDKLFLNYHVLCAHPYLSLIHILLYYKLRRSRHKRAPGGCPDTKRKSDGKEHYEESIRVER